MTVRYDPVVRMIPVKQIQVMNPRDRAKKKFTQIVQNIARIGLKRPVTLAHAGGKNGEARFNLVCGQGRLEAYISLGQEEIPAIIVEGTKEELLLMSLAENLARRQHSTVELVRQISLMKKRGNTHSEIARKTDLDITYVRGILQLLDRGEERLLQAVEKGQLPVSIAITIATTDDKGIQRALQEAYESHALRGKQLLKARRLLETRRTRGKSQHGGPRKPNDRPVTTVGLLKTYKDEAVKQKLIVQKAKISETRLLFAVSAMKQLFRDENFVTLLRAERLDSLPQYLAQQIYGSGKND
ncbi:MAG: plasmid partitioning protein RepB C-terminal domain-containing protein [Pirellulales bacterium]